MLFFTCSPVRTLVTDAQGRQAGLDPVTGQIINEIPDTVVTKDGTHPHVILLPSSQASYRIEVNGVDTGDYQLHIMEVISDSSDIFGKSLVGSTVPGQRDIITFAPLAFQESGGQLAIEAEHFTWLTEVEQRNWITQTALPGYSGSAYLSALPDTDRQFELDITSSVELQYALNITTTGTYNVWMRGYAPNSTGDSIYIGLDDQPAISFTGFVPRTWSWADRTPQSDVATIEVTEPGLHILRIWQREDGVRLDRILLTTDSEYNPSGNGPPESEIR